MWKKSKALRWVVIIGVALVMFYQGVKPLGADIKDAWEKITDTTATEQTEE